MMIAATSYWCFHVQGLTSALSPVLRIVLQGKCQFRFLDEELDPCNINVPGHTFRNILVQGYLTAAHALTHYTILPSVESSNFSSDKMETKQVK